MQTVIELPFFSTTAGGVIESIKLAEKMPGKVLLRFQMLTNEYPKCNLSWSVGIPDNTFPYCDNVITYSDTPHLKRLIANANTKRVFINMLSWGMSIEAERNNAKSPKVTVLCSTKKIEQAMLKEGISSHRIGFGLDMDNMFDEGLHRNNFVAIMYHPMASKRYDLAIKIADEMYDRGIIKGCITFGTSEGYAHAKKPNCLVEHIYNATRDDIRYVFNICKCFVMPSVSEGLNLTPIEATLCGCPAVICDGAIGEIFTSTKNCVVVERDNRVAIKTAISFVLDNPTLSELYRVNMEGVVKEHTWDKVIENLNLIL